MIEFKKSEFSANFTDAEGNHVERVQQVQSDITGFELASGEMTTFTFPESVAAMARVFWKKDSAEGE